MARWEDRSRDRGVTLVEVLLVLVIVTLIYGVTMLGSGFADAARLRRSALLIASAVRVAYGHANASSNTVRLVFDFDAQPQTVAIEEATTRLAVAKNERTGGAAATTEAERKAQEEADGVLKGPRAPRPTFQGVSTLGFQLDKSGKASKPLERNVRFLQIETAHEDDPAKAGKAYLYFWPGGQTERASVQLTIRGSIVDADTTTVLVSPLTGKAEIRKGRLPMQRPRDDVEESERRDTGF